MPKKSPKKEAKTAGKGKGEALPKVGKAKRSYPEQGSTKSVKKGAC